MKPSDGGFVIPPALLTSGMFPVSDETLIDLGLATPEIIERYERRRAAAEKRWRALPWRVRFWRMQVRPRIDETRYRLSHAWRALRGVDCERDW